MTPYQSQIRNYPPTRFTSLTLPDGTFVPILYSRLLDFGSGRAAQRAQWIVRDLIDNRKEKTSGCSGPEGEEPWWECYGPDPEDGAYRVACQTVGDWDEADVCLNEEGFCPPDAEIFEAVQR